MELRARRWSAMRTVERIPADAICPNAIAMPRIDVRGGRGDAAPSADRGTIEEAGAVCDLD